MLTEKKRKDLIEFRAFVKNEIKLLKALEKDYHYNNKDQIKAKKQLVKDITKTLEE